MDVFTDIDIFKELINATLRGVVVYVLLDESQFKSFHAMSHRMGINIQDLKNIRVRTVQGQQYRCQSGLKFHGGLEQKFILVDCRTVLYGTYSFTWSYEKINLSMVLVVTGQLVCSYDEEFRRLYARSTVPKVLSMEMPPVQHLRDTVAMQSPKSSQLSLHQIHMSSRVMHGMRSAQDDRFTNVAMLIRGLSVQDRLHQSHSPEVGNLVRGHSYGGELQKLNSMTRLRMGTKNIGVPLAPERTGSNRKGRGNVLVTNRLSQQQLRHQTRYGADQNLIPFNSETSLHKWKINTYLNECDMPLDGSCDAQSLMMSQYSSHTGLNESQLIHSRSRDINSRMEEMRQKRLSLQDNANLRSMYPPLDRPKLMSSLRGLDMRQSLTESELNVQNSRNLEPSNHKYREPNNKSNKREQTLTDGHRSASHYDVKMVPDQKMMQTWPSQPPSRTTSAAELDMKLNDPSLKLSHLQSSSLSIQHLRAMESLTEIPEEKDVSNAHVISSDSPALADRCEAVGKEIVLNYKSSSLAGSQCQDQATGSPGSIGKVANSSGSATPRKGKTSTSSETDNIPKISNTSAEPQEAVEVKNNQTEKQPEDPALQRKNSMRMKVQSMLSSDEKKTSKKEEKSLQRKASMRSQSGSNQALAAEQRPKKGPLPNISRSQSFAGSAAETEKHKSPFLRLSSQRSSKRKTKPADEGSRNAPDNEGRAVSLTRHGKTYSRYEYLLSPESIPVDKSMRMSGMYPSDKDRSSSLSRRDAGSPMYQAQSGTDNKLGRFMQRVGNLITKNK
ncbi:protein FAM83B-like isoform X2 [Mastacembelus armatus]|nr:protein FAM83B-like isoform X2 [Mastacembelus armatus]